MNDGNMAAVPTRHMHTGSYGHLIALVLTHTLTRTHTHTHTYTHTHSHTHSLTLLTPFQGSYLAHTQGKKHQSNL